MKRRYFLLIFVLVLIFSFYSPNRNGLIYNGPGCSCTGNTNQQSQDVSGGQGAFAFCYEFDQLDTSDGLIPSNVLDARIPAIYFYEEVPTNLNGFWEFVVNNKNMFVEVSTVSDKGDISRVPVTDLQKSSASTENCMVYAFPYQRLFKIINFVVPYNAESVGTNGIKTCYYNPDPITLALISMGGRSISYEGQLCPDLSNGGGRDLGISSTDPCPVTATCIGTIFQGEESWYYALFELDSCGNRIVKPLNEGKPFTREEAIASGPTFAKNAVDACKFKYECGNGVLDVDEECDGSLFISDLKCSDFVHSPPYNSGDLKCSSTCEIDESECSYDLSGKIVAFGDIIKFGMGGYPEIKIFLDLNIKDARDGELPESVVFTTKMEAGSFTALQDYKNPFFAALFGTLSFYAETSPNLFSVMREAQETGNFIPTGILMKINKNDGKTIDAIYSRDTTLYTNIWDRKIIDWFTGTITVSMDFNDDGSASVVVDSIISTEHNRYSKTNSYTKNVDAQTAKAIFFDILKRYASAVGRPLGKQTGTPVTLLLPDLAGIRSMASTMKVGDKIPIVQNIWSQDDTFDKRVDYIDPTDENKTGGKVIDYIKDIINYLDSFVNDGEFRRISSVGDFDFSIFGTTDVA